MIPAPEPQREAARLAALLRYRILDTAPEVDFDDLVQLAVQICACPMAAISLIDREHQWFKSKIGLEPDEIPLDSFAGLSDDELLCISDLSELPGHPLRRVLPQVRFIAAMPVLSPEGVKLGSVCVMDRVPRELSETQGFALRTLARQVMHILELRLRLREAEQIQADLITSSEDTRKLMESSPVPLLLIRLEQTGRIDSGKTLYVNQALTRLLGYGLADIPDITTWFEKAYPDPEYRRAVMAEGARRIQTQGIELAGEESNEVWVTDSGGRSHRCEIARSRFGDSLLISLYDVTERKRMEDALKVSEENTRRVIELSPVPNILIEYSESEKLTPDSKVLLVNQAFTQMLGYNLAEVPDVGTLQDKLYPDPEYRQAVLDSSLKRIEIAGREALRTGLATAWMTGHDGQRHLVERISSRFENKLLVCFHDLSERMEMEENLREAKEVAEAASRTKSEFLANMSHEIRTPMNAIIGLNHLLEKTGLNPKQSDYVHKIQAAAQNLLRVINDILDFSKIEAGKLELESVPFNLDHALENLSALLSLKAHDKGLELIFDLRDNVPEELVGDSLRLEQILLNLVTNAIKFTEEGSVTVAIKVQQESPEDVVLRFSVMDTGIGLSAEQQARLFQAFSQADASTTRQFGGTGLGLSISKRLTELMGGEIGVESTADRGSCFWFTARFKKQLEKSSRQVMPPEITGMQALVVDDQVHVQEIISDYLRGFGMRVLTAGSGKAALHLLQPDKAGPIRLVLLDWKMPGMDGIETLRQLRGQLPAEAQPAVILMTAYGREDLLTQLERQDVDGILLKPLTPSTVYDAILEALQLSPPPPESVQQPTPWREQLEFCKGAKLLLVEDNLINQQVAQELLEAEGFQVQLAKNGQQALERLQQHNYDLVLMDLQMPVMDGYTATRQIRQDPQWQDLPILAMTADAVAGVRELVMAAGMNDCITKPIEMEELFGALIRWLPHMEGRPRPEADAAPPRPQGPQLPDIPGINLKSALYRASGNSRLYLKLLAEFCEIYADFGATGKRMAGSGEDGEFYRMVHTLTGVAGNLGMEALHQTARQLEARLKAGEPAAAETAQLEAEIEQMIAQLHQVLEHFTPGPESSHSDEELNQALNPEDLAMLEELLEQFDPAAQLVLDRLTGLPAAARAAIGQALDDFDFESAKTLFNELRAARWKAVNSEQ